MDQPTFESISERLWREANQTMLDKRPGYTTGTQDVLSNFKRIAEQIGTIPEKVCLVYLLKHLDSIRTVVNAVEAKTPIYDPEPWEARVKDIFNYVLLLHALLHERAHPQTPEENHHV